MKTFVAAAFALATLAAAPLPAVASTVAAICGDSAPAGWKNPGGYCDQIGAGSGSRSLSNPSETSPGTPCVVASLEHGERILVAAPLATDSCGNPIDCDHPLYGLVNGLDIMMQPGRVWLVGC